MSRERFDLPDDLVVRDRKDEDRRLLACHVDHRQLALVRLTDPTPLRELLNEAHALALGIGKIEGEDDVERGARSKREHAPDRDSDQPLLALIFDLREIHGRAQSVRRSEQGQPNARMTP